MYTPCQQRMQYLVEFTLPEDSTHSEEEGEEQVGGAKEAGEEGETNEQPETGEGRRILTCSTKALPDFQAVSIHVHV